MNNAVSVRKIVATHYGAYCRLHLGTAGRDALIACGFDADSEHTKVTHYNLRTGEERGTARLNGGGGGNGMATVLYNNKTCIALSYE